MCSQNTFIRALVSLFVLAGLITFASPAKAQKKKVKKPSRPAKKKGDKVNIKNLKKKYWAPKDKDFSVVQNRRYSKKKRFAVSGTYGPIINDKYNEGFNFGLTGNYFFNERMGMEFGYINAQLDQNAVTDELNRMGGNPDYGRIQNVYTLGFNWVPFYAKMSVLGKKIIYFDMAITPVVGLTQYDKLSSKGDKSASSLTYGFDITQMFFLTKHVAVRADIKNRYFREEVLEFTTGKKKNAETNQTFMFLLGVTYFH